MSTLRLATSILLRASRASVPRVVRQPRALPLPSPRAAPAVYQLNSFRFYSVLEPKPATSKIYSYEDVRHLVTHPTGDRVLVDTREPGELQSTGTIPGSINVPVTSQPDAFFITAEEFEDRFGFERPAKEQEVVFYCKAGVRSRAAAELARQAGWEKVGEYPGSWLDWEKNGGPTKGEKS